MWFVKTFQLQIVKIFQSSTGLPGTAGTGDTAMTLALGTCQMFPEKCRTSGLDKGRIM